MLLLWILMGFVGCLIGAFKNRKITGLLCGFILGPVGWIIMLFVEPTPEGEPERVMGPLGKFLLLLILLGAAIVAFGIWAENNPETLRRLTERVAATPVPMAAATPEPPVQPTPTEWQRQVHEWTATPSPAEVRAEIERRYGAK